MPNVARFTLHADLKNKQSPSRPCQKSCAFKLGRPLPVTRSRQPNAFYVGLPSRHFQSKMHRKSQGDPKPCKLGCKRDIDEPYGTFLREMQMTVARILDRKGATTVTVRSDTTVTESIQLLSQHNIGALVVSDDGVSVAGILSERDIIRGLSQSGPSLFKRPVGEIMIREVETCSPRDTTVSLLARMTKQRIRHMPVVKAGQLTGIVSIGDVVKLRLDDLAKDNESMRDYISH